MPIQFSNNLKYIIINSYCYIKRIKNSKLIYRYKLFYLSKHPLHKETIHFYNNFINYENNFIFIQFKQNKIIKF